MRYRQIQVIQIKYIQISYNAHKCGVSLQWPLFWGRNFSKLSFGLVILNSVDYLLTEHSALKT